MPKHQNYVTGFMFGVDAYENQVALILKQKPAWMKGFWNGIGGKIEDGEDPWGAMAREFAEETSVHTTFKDWELCVVMKGNCEGGGTFTNYCFRSFSPRVNLVKTVEAEEVARHDISLMGESGYPIEAWNNLWWLVPMLSDRKKEHIIYPITVGYK
jgi:8-oxo-dGTP diphosphatase